MAQWHKHASSPEGAELALAPADRLLFSTTHRSVVLAVGHGVDAKASAALEALCRSYWYPLYAFVRRQGHSPENFTDLIPVGQWTDGGAESWRRGDRPAYGLCSR